MRITSTLRVLEFNDKRLYLNLEREKENRSLAFTSKKCLEYGRFKLNLCPDGKEMYKKRDEREKLMFC